MLLHLQKIQSELVAVPKATLSATARASAPSVAPFWSKRISKSKSLLQAFEHAATDRTRYHRHQQPELSAPAATHLVCNHHTSAPTRQTQDFPQVTQVLGPILQAGVEPAVHPDIMAVAEWLVCSVVSLGGPEGEPSRLHHNSQYKANNNASRESNANATSSHCPLNTHHTAGVSYVVRTESKQVGCAAERYKPLSHLVYRPPGLALSPCPRIQECVRNVIVRAPVLACSVPATDEDKMKQYLLNQQPAGRVSALRSAKGAKMMHLHGLGGIRPLLRDRNFFCLHYKYDKDKLVKPCVGMMEDDVDMGRLNVNQSLFQGKCARSTDSSIRCSVFPLLNKSRLCADY